MTARRTCLFEPLELIERLAALVPAPRTHLVKYRGVLAPCAGWRDRVIPNPRGGVRSVLLGEPLAGRRGNSPPVQGKEEDLDPPARDAAHGVPLGGPPLATGVPQAPAWRPAPGPEDDSAPVGKPHRQNRTWVQLMQRVFDLDVMECPACGGRLRILAAIQDPDAIRAILDCLGLSSRPPPPPSPTPSDRF